MRPRYVRDSTNSTGQTPNATRARGQSRRAVTTIIVVSVIAAVTNGMAPSTRMFWMAGASYWMRYRESDVPRES